MSNEKVVNAATKCFTDGMTPEEVAFYAKVEWAKLDYLTWTEVKARRYSEHERMAFIAGALRVAHYPALIALAERVKLYDDALASCGIGGIYDSFTSPADAITQMAAYIKEFDKAGAGDEKCEWKEDDEGNWFSKCGTSHWSEDGGTPAESSMNYCPKCGKPIVAVPYVEPDEDDKP